MTVIPVRKWSYIIIAILAIIVFVGTNVPAWGAKSAKQMQSQIERNREARDKHYERIMELKKESNTLHDMIGVIDQRMDAKMEEISNIERNLAEAYVSLDRLNTESQELKGQLADKKQKLASRASAIYMEGELSYIDLILASVDFSEFIDRLYFVQAVMESDQVLIGDINSRQEQLQERLVGAQAQIEEIELIKSQLDRQRAELETIWANKRQDLQLIEQDKELCLKQIRELEAENKRIAEDIREIERRASGYKGKAWTGNFNVPINGPVTSGYGMRKHPVYGYNRMHTGIDISAPKGTAIKPGGEGKVIYTGTRGGYGKTVIVDHGNGRTTLYAHMSRITCDAGDHVTTSSKLGEVGSTGTSTGNHLHFEVRVNGEPVDPTTAMK